MKFLADRMLGKLARWLRVAGFDCAYEREGGHDRIIARAAREGRVVLTRDTRLLGHKDLGERLFVRHDRIDDQLRQVFGHFDIDPLGNAFTRCLLCNAQMEEVERAEVEALVPPHVFATQKVFTRCPICRRIYWAATHRDNMLQRLCSLKP